MNTEGEGSVEVQPRESTVDTRTPAEIAFQKAREKRVQPLNCLSVSCTASSLRSGAAFSSNLINPLSHRQTATYIFANITVASVKTTFVPL